MSIFHHIYIKNQLKKVQKKGSEMVKRAVIRVKGFLAGHKTNLDKVPFNCEKVSLIVTQKHFQQKDSIFKYYSSLPKNHIFLG
jgi:hypothetical protein